MRNRTNVKAETKFLLMFAVILASGFAWGSDFITAREAIARFNACTNFLKMPAKQKAEVVHKTNLSLSQAVASCRSVVAYGRAGALRAAKEWNRWERSREQNSGGTSDEAPYCDATSECSSLEQCKYHRCVTNSDTCISDSQCSSGDTCNAGVCGK